MMMNKLLIPALVLATGLCFATSSLGEDSVKFFDGLSEDTTIDNIFLRRKVDGQEGYPTMRKLFGDNFADSLSLAYRIGHWRNQFEIMKEHEANGSLAEYIEGRGLSSDIGLTVFDLMKEHDAEGSWDEFIRDLDFADKFNQPCSSEKRRNLNLLADLRSYLIKCSQAMWACQSEVGDVVSDRRDLKGFLLLRETENARIILKNAWFFTGALLTSQLEEEPETWADCCKGLFFNRDAAQAKLRTLQILLRVLDDQLLIVQGYEIKKLLQAAVDSLEVSIPRSCELYESKESPFSSPNK